MRSSRLQNPNICQSHGETVNLVMECIAQTSVPNMCFRDCNRPGGLVRPTYVYESRPQPPNSSNRHPYMEGRANLNGLAADHVQSSLGRGVSRQFSKHQSTCHRWTRSGRPKTSTGQPTRRDSKAAVQSPSLAPPRTAHLARNEQPPAQARRHRLPLPAAAHFPRRSQSAVLSFLIHHV